MSSTDDSGSRGDRAGLSIQLAVADDTEQLERIAALVAASCRAAHLPMPAGTAGLDGLQEHLAERLHLAQGWVATAADGSPLGFALATPGWLEMLYVHPGHVGAGVGSALLGLVKHTFPEGFGLWVFAGNEAAREFYRRGGLVELEVTDGRDNQAGRPDVRMMWPGQRPLDYLRSQVDDADDELASVLVRRLALTREIQRHKPVPGHEGRDLEREVEIASRLARRAPELSIEEWSRIVHTVVSASLDAVEREQRDHPDT